MNPLPRLRRYFPQRGKIWEWEIFPHWGKWREATKGALFVNLLSGFAGRGVLGGDQLGQLGLEPQLEIINHFIDHGYQHQR